MNILFLLGFAIVLGFLGSFVFKKVKIPQVVGYIVIGVILGESFFKTTAAYAEEKRRSSLPGFRMAQWVVYTMVTVAFLFSIGGETAWRQLFEMPSLKGVLNLLVAIMDTLFSTKGLAALGSCLIINSAVGLFLYRLINL